VLPFKGVIIVALVFGLGVAVSPAAAPSATTDFGGDLVERYLNAVSQQKELLRGASMEVEIDAQLPKLKKWGKLNALRYISQIGKISYLMRSFVGDDTVKKDVIARYLQAEVQAQDTNQQVAITPANYKFKYKGQQRRNDQLVHVFQLSPHKKKVGLFKGELWVDPETYLPVRESGRLVKNPSVFLKRVDFVRDYKIENGIAYPKRIDSIVDTRLVGRAELHINFTNYSRETDSSEAIASDTLSRE
jgi:hypothetical protein